MTALPPHIRVFIALHEVPDAAPWEMLAEHAGVSMNYEESSMESLLYILQHALGCDQFGKARHGRGGYRNHFCAGDGGAEFALCREAVAQGLMREHQPSPISGGDAVFTVTDAGKSYVAEHSPPEPKLTRGQRRYRDWLGSAAADCGVTFGEWLREANGAR